MDFGFLNAIVRQCVYEKRSEMFIQGGPKVGIQLLKLFFMCFEVTSSALYVAQK